MKSLTESSDYRQQADSDFVRSSELTILDSHGFLGILNGCKIE